VAQVEVLLLLKSPVEQAAVLEPENPSVAQVEVLVRLVAR
jgi:hypothetical protein